MRGRGAWEPGRGGHWDWGRWGAGSRVQGVGAEGAGERRGRRGESLPREDARGGMSRVAGGGRARARGDFTGVGRRHGQLYTIRLHKSSGRSAWRRCVGGWSPDTRMCSGGKADVFTFSGDVFTFRANAFSFWGDVFSLAANVFSKEGQRGEGREVGRKQGRGCGSAGSGQALARRRTGFRGRGDVSTLSGECVQFLA